MESKLERKYGAWEYTSKSGLKYTIGEVTAEFNVIIDDFMDIVEMFDTNVLIPSHMVSYVYGDLEHGNEEERDSVKEWIDDTIDEYEKYKRRVRFYRDIIGRDCETLYECYIGTEMEVEDNTTRISLNELKKMVAEDRSS